MTLRDYKLLQERGHSNGHIAYTLEYVVLLIYTFCTYILFNVQFYLYRFNKLN